MFVGQSARFHRFLYKKGESPLLQRQGVAFFTQNDQKVNLIGGDPLL